VNHLKVFFLFVFSLLDFFLLQFDHFILNWFKSGLCYLFMLACYSFLMVSKNKSHAPLMLNLTNSNSNLLFFFIESFQVIFLGHLIFFKFYQYQINLGSSLMIYFGWLGDSRGVRKQIKHSIDALRESNLVLLILFPIKSFYGQVNE
jgi:hypothetical protein